MAVYRAVNVSDTPGRFRKMPLSPIGYLRERKQNTVLQTVSLKEKFDSLFFYTVVSCC